MLNRYKEIQYYQVKRFFFSVIFRLGEFMALLNSEALLDLKSKVNIVDVISQYVALSKNGKNYLGLCPFHGEKTP